MNDYQTCIDLTVYKNENEYIGCEIPADFDGYIVITHTPDFLEEDDFKI